MKQLIKQYFHLFGDIIRPEKIFPNFISCFHHLFDLSNLRLLMEFPVPHKNQQKSISVGFFLFRKQLKIKT